jgi:hypothetical protein
MESGGFQNHPLMRLTIGLTLVLLLAFWITDFALYGSKMGLRPSSVVLYYNGSEESFLPPRTAGSMVEVTHAHLAMMAVVLLLLTHLVIFSPFRKGVKLLLIWGTFTAAILSEAGGWLVRFVSPQLAFVKVAGFLVLQGFLGVLLFTVARALWRGPSSNGNGGAIARNILLPRDLGEQDRLVPMGSEEDSR